MLHDHTFEAGGVIRACRSVERHLLRVCRMLAAVPATSRETTFPVGASGKKLGWWRDYAVDGGVGESGIGDGVCACPQTEDRDRSVDDVAVAVEADGADEAVLDVGLVELLQHGRAGAVGSRDRV